MKPKELEEEYGITKERIKLYKKSGIFTPNNPPSRNRATDYTECDIEQLKFIEILTKSGLTCSDIKKLQDNEINMKDAIISRRKLIEDDIKRKTSALIMLDKLSNDEVTFENFDVELYWDIIKDKENHGEKFIDIGYEIPFDFIRTFKCPYCGEELEIDLEDYLSDTSSYERENGMGPDMVYYFDSTDALCCDFCKKNIKIVGWIREYPIGAIDSEDILIEGDDSDD